MAAKENLGQSATQQRIDTVWPRGFAPRDHAQLLAEIRKNKKK